MAKLCNDLLTFSKLHEENLQRSPDAMSIEIGQLQCQRNTSVSGITLTSISWNFSTFDTRMPILFCRNTDPKTMNILMMYWKDIFVFSLMQIKDQIKIIVVKRKE